MSQTIRRYIADRENFDFSRGTTVEELKARELRINFLQKYIFNFDTTLYKTQQERDWAYICKREYNYDVVLTGAGYGLMGGLLGFSWRVWINKRAVFSPLFIIPPIIYYFSTISLLNKHSKKLFDMCNLGPDFFLGQKRHEILVECNKVLDVEDF